MDKKFENEEKEYLKTLNQEKSRNYSKLRNEHMAKVLKAKLMLTQRNEKKSDNHEGTPFQEENSYSVAANTRSKLRSHRPYKIFAFSG